MPEYTYFKYYKDVNDNSKRAVKSTVQNFKNRIKTNRKFLDGFKFHVVTSTGDLDMKSELTRAAAGSYDDCGGLTVPPVLNKGKKEIIINAGGFYTNRSSSDISQLILHEIGHQFDYSFGKHDSVLEEKISKIIFPVPDGSEGDKLYNRWMKTKDLSDSEEFKSAWKQDVERLNNGSFLDKVFNKLPFEYTPYDIDISDGVTDEEVEEADSARSEIFAQLFSYAMGEDDGNKDVITKKYKNSYRMVQSYIEKYLGIEL